RIPQRSLGSGVIVDPSGIALTNAHVIDKATEIEVVTLDGGKHRAKVIGVDKKTDLAVLKLDDGKGTFKYARLGDSDRAQVGDWVGVSIRPLTPELAGSFGSKDAKGVLINEVMPDSPAAKAGLKPGDILLEFEGRSMEGPGDLQRAVGFFSPDRSAKVKIWRD